MKLPEYITFDCYGTLIDFEINKVTLEILGSRVAQLADVKAFLSRYSRIRFEEVQGEYRPYADMLRTSTEKAWVEYGLAYRPEDGEALVAAVPTWGPFPDTRPVLAKLAQHCKLVIISNAEDEMIAHNVDKIGVPFHAVITAEQARSYKPGHGPFLYALEKLGCEPADILHAANSYTYDIIPCSELGWRRVWINRGGWPGDQAKHGPYEEFPDLRGLLGLLGID